MGELKVLCFSVSLDGYGAGSRQSLENPMGLGGMALHEWVFPTRTFQAMHAQMTGASAEEGATGLDDDFAAKGAANLGAWILGRNMFGPIRGPWPNGEWKGWWGEEPPYHVPVFVLTHHARPPLIMAGGTTFYFVTDGVESALAQARTAAGHRDIRVGGGVSTVRQYLEAQLVDEMHLAIAPTLLGSGESLWQGLDLKQLGYRVVDQIASPKATHVIIRK